MSLPINFDNNVNLYSEILKFWWFAKGLIKSSKTTAAKEFIPDERVLKKINNLSSCLRKGRRIDKKNNALSNRPWKKWTFQNSKTMDNNRYLNVPLNKQARKTPGKPCKCPITSITKYGRTCKIFGPRRVKIVTNQNLHVKTMDSELCEQNKFLLLFSQV